MKRFPGKSVLTDTALMRVMLFRWPKNLSMGRNRPHSRGTLSTARYLDVQVFFHSEGNIRAVRLHIVATGVDRLKCLEPATAI